MKIYVFCFILIALLFSSCTSTEVALTPPPELDPGIDPGEWALVPAGEFYLGQHEHETNVDYNYEIMVTDVTTAQYADYLNKALADGSVNIAGEQVVGYYPGDEFHAHEHELEIKAGDWLHIPLDDTGLRLDFDGNTFTPQPGYENHPMSMVTWFGAKAYCDFNDWRLPTEVEWEKAGDTTPVGFYNGSTYEGYATVDSPSPYGLYDMAGNVWQWSGDVYDDQHYRYMRGGSKDNYAYNLRVWTRNSAGPDYFSPAVGFRCLRDASN
jgi:formylglycine-generating enzyme required for sulfatase activity